jgi:hypothetical protein
MKKPARWNAGAGGGETWMRTSRYAFASPHGTSAAPQQQQHAAAVKFVIVGGTIGV